MPASPVSAGSSRGRSFGSAGVPPYLRAPLSMHPCRWTVAQQISIGYEPALAPLRTKAEGRKLTQPWFCPRCGSKVNRLSERGYGGVCLQSA